MANGVEGRGRNLVTVLAVVTALQLTQGHAAAEPDCGALTSAIDRYAIEQMERFGAIRPAGQPPLGQTFGWGTGVAFPPTELAPPPLCGSPPGALAPLANMKYRGDSYDQSLLALWFVERARLAYAAGNTTEGDTALARSQNLLDALIFLSDHDPFGDGRLRAAYWVTDLLNQAGTEASIMAPDVSVGNLAYFGIALTRFFAVAATYDVDVEDNYVGAPSSDTYLNRAEHVANWIIAHTMDTDGPGGFTGGYSGWNAPPLEQVPFTWKSTEHNLDAYVLARNLYSLRGDAKWRDMADHASAFVQAMYVELGEATGYYVTGTATDGITLNPSPIPADAQAWTALARNGYSAVDSVERAQYAMQWLLANLKEGCACDVTPDVGVRFSDIGTGMQSEVTASTALALLWLGQETQQADDFLALLEWLQANPPLSGDGVTDHGIAATPCSAGASTGYGVDAWYYPLQHGASSVWSGFACMVREGDTQANPLAPLPLYPEAVPSSQAWGLLGIMGLLLATGAGFLALARKAAV